ncbi:MAG: mevalonate kinase [Candidatus Undinarchaeales archaeon]|jgi:mevalonate kinase|nr:mevalonate kinase [Candidatus Undinarchaeales archaeon]MDP7492459.1 mevalonate kinase [Candidatus Undinarchaeales archaeon]
MVTVSVPGKVYLIGEHAVVYGKPAIIAAVGRRVTVNAEPADRVQIIDNQMGSEMDWSVDECLIAGRRANELWKAGNAAGDFTELFQFTKGDAFKRAAIGTFMNEFGVSSGCALTIESSIPLGSGLGSSSALSVALAAVVAELNGLSVPREEVNRLAYLAERYKHGRPSGGDNTACCYGGLVWFRKDTPENVIRSLKEEVPYSLEDFVLVYIKEPERTTGELVSHVRSLDPAVRDPLVDDISEATHMMRTALKGRDVGSVAGLIDRAWDDLAGLGLSVPEADELVARIRAAGGAAKLCGACGGGIMLVHSTDRARLDQVIKDAGYEPWETELGVEGLRVEH